MKKQTLFPFSGTRRAILSLLLIAVAATTVVARSADPEVSAPLTVILVRHAEKAVVPPENKDPDLSTAGLARAETLKKMFGDAGVSAVYATQYKRTQQTAKPLADKLGVPVTQVDARNTAELVKQLRAQSGGQVILITGHNNTVPEVIAALGGPKLPVIPETEYDNIFIMTVMSDGSTKLLKLKY